MPQKEMTVGLDPQVRKGLEKLAGVLRRPINQLVNEAVREFVARRSHDETAELESTLADLRAYIAADPDFERAIDAVVRAEVMFGHDDPAQGRDCQDFRVWAGG